MVLNHHLDGNHGMSQPFIHRRRQRKPVPSGNSARQKVSKQGYCLHSGIRTFERSRSNKLSWFYSHDRFTIAQMSKIRCDQISIYIMLCSPLRATPSGHAARSAKTQNDNRLIGHSVDIEYIALSVTSESSPPPVPQLIYRRWKAQVLSSENFR